MRSLRFLALCIFCVSLLPSLFAQNPEKATLKNQAGITFTEIFHDFGTVGNDTTLTYLFKFYSTGKDSLHILRLKSG